MPVETLLSIDDFLDLPESPEIARELLHRRVIERSAPALPHAAIQARLSLLLGLQVDRQFPHLIVASHSGFLLNEDTVQAPDVFLLDRQRYRTMEGHRGALRGAPDLAVEIISPSDYAVDVDEKVEAYLAAGTKTVWLVWPNTRHVHIYHANGDRRNASLQQAIDAPEILPGVSIPVASIFPEL